MEFTAKATWTRAGTEPMPIIEVGLAQGFEPIVDDLGALKKAGTVRRYSLSQGRVVLYLDSIRDVVPVVVTFGIRATLPGRMKTPPTRAYPYHEPETGAETAPVRLTVR